MAVAWSSIESYVQRAFDMQGRVERADVIDLAYNDNADDDIVDAIDALGSRVFQTVDATRDFLAGQKLVTL